jgi:peptidyl-dipeptidase Dcp
MTAILASGAIATGANSAAGQAGDTKFGPSNPFYTASTLPFQAPPFDKIKDSDYQPAIEAGMAQELAEVQAIADNSQPPTFENTLVAMQKTGQLLSRAIAVFGSVVQANSDPELLKIRADLAPKLSAHSDAIVLNEKLFARISTIYKQRDTLKLNPESLRLLEVTYDNFVRAGANLSPADKEKLKKLNEQLSTLSNDFSEKLLAATKAGAYYTDNKAALAGFTDAQFAAASDAAKGRDKASGYVLPLQNTTQQPEAATLTDRATRKVIFDNSWDRAEHNDANDTRETIAKLAQLRAQRARHGRSKTRWPRRPRTR